MSYLVFARKYRPQDFSEVIGQESVVKRLTEAINTKRIHQAYLFSGPRGVGKTSLARILAKALNCQAFEEPTVNPCGKCTSCVEIQEGRSLDVIEIDGASNRGIDEIRQLRENVKFAPSYSRYKIYIIDEVHQITHDAFNALLKTLEEPPEHVKFIFATTAPHKVPLTILSRCQRFNFRLLSEDEIITKLEFIAEKENISTGKDILKYIAKSSLGSIRDAESIFDQITPLLLEGAEFKDILDILGQIPEYKIYYFIEALFKKQAETALSLVNEMVEEGYELENFLNGVIDYIRNVLLAKVDKELFLRITELSSDLQEKILALSKLTEISFLVKVIECLVEVKKTGKFLPSLRIPLEVEIIKLASLLEERARESTSEAFSSREEKLKSSQTEGFMHKSATLNLESLSKFVTSLKPKPSSESIQQNKSISEEAEISLEEVKAIWEDLIKDISSNKISIATYLREAELCGIEANTIKLGFPKNFKFHKEFLEANTRKRIVEESLSGKLNKRVRVEYILTDEVKETKKESKSFKEHLGKIIKSFGGEIIS